MCSLFHRPRRQLCPSLCLMSTNATKQDRNTRASSRFARLPGNPSSTVVLRSKSCDAAHCCAASEAAVHISYTGKNRASSVVSNGQIPLVSSCQTTETLLLDAYEMLKVTKVNRLPCGWQPPSAPLPSAFPCVPSDHPPPPPPHTHTHIHANPASSPPSTPLAPPPIPLPHLA